MKKKIIILIVLIVIIAVLGILIHGLSSKKEKPVSDTQTIISDMDSSEKDEIVPSGQTDSTSSEKTNEDKAEERKELSENDSEAQTGSESDNFKPGSEEFVVELEEDEAFDIN